MAFEKELKYYMLFKEALAVEAIKLRIDQHPARLRVVDPHLDLHVWAIVDDGCDSCTHSDAARQNAEEKWNKPGSLRTP